jgi:hypothetical protein
MDAPHPHPLDDQAIETLWLAATGRLGFRVERTTLSYASFAPPAGPASDGRGTILVGTRETLDPDDSLAQLLFHELCHALVQGEENLARPDWGLDNTSDGDLGAEHACLRLQAHLADAHALRSLMAPTTISRAYYQALPAFPLQQHEPAAALARQALSRSSAPGSACGHWQGALDAALAATASAVVARGRWSAVADAHPLGFAPGPAAQTCGGCAWRYQSRGAEGGAAGQGWRCRQSAGPDGNGQPVHPTFPACVRWEAPLDCRACAACCREGFDSVSVGVREQVVWRHPSLVVRGGPRFRLRREDGRCAALLLEAPGAAAPFSCAVYQDRPQACREILPGDRRCLSARRRLDSLGLGPGGPRSHG